MDTFTSRVSELHLTEKQLEELRPFAHYIWWKDTEQTMRRPDLLIGQVMNIGRFDDMCRLIEIVGHKVMLSVLNAADPGQFSLQSWTYWHYRLTDIAPGKVPPLPKRRFA